MPEDQSGDAQPAGASSRNASSRNAGSSGGRTPREWLKLLGRYREPDSTRSFIEIVVTVVPFIGFWGLAWFAATYSYWLALIAIVPAAFFLVRLFLIQHDCGHGAFFRNRSVNNWVGRTLGVLTLTAYEVWRRDHAAHHATHGNLDRRGMGDIDTLTVREYRALSPVRRLMYRLYRQPFVMFGIGPAYVFLLRNRLPLGLMTEGWSPWLSTMGTNVSALVAGGLLAWLIGPVSFLSIHLPIVLLAASIGVWLFYVQHQFEETVWEGDADWDLPDAALHGSSHYDLPKPLPWLTANIGVHHVHHLVSRIPFYRLPEVLRDHPELAEIQRIGLWESLKCVRYKLWDEEARRLVTFREARSLA